MGVLIILILLLWVSWLFWFSDYSDSPFLPLKGLHDDDNEADRKLAANAYLAIGILQGKVGKSKEAKVALNQAITLSPEITKRANIYLEDYN